MSRLPVNPARRVAAAAEPAVDRLREGRRAARSRAERLIPGRRRSAVDVAGWSTTDFLAYAAAGTLRDLPPPRAGRDAVIRINALSGSMPIEATLLARAITDAAPAPDAHLNPTLLDVLERYLPESLNAFEVSSRRRGQESAEQLLLAQLRLLHSVALDIEQADAEHNERDLQIQDRFLRERFANLTPGELEIGTRPTLSAPIRSLDAPLRPRAKAAPVEGRAYLRPDRDSVVLFRRESPGPWDLALRLALPKGHAVTLGVVEESTSGAVQFTHRTGRRVFTSRRSTGFRAAQVDLALPVRLASPRRFLVYAEGSAGRGPTGTVLFVRSDARSQAEVATTLTNHARAPLTVIASGYETTDGLILRNESVVFPDLQSACTGFGYHHITWLDRHSPVV